MDRDLGGSGLLGLSGFSVPTLRPVSVALC